MIDKEKWMHDITEKLRHAFGDRLLFVGLQGSYVRNEATETSDFDVVVVLDTVSVHDLILYRSLVDAMPESDKACGFVGGAEELRNWPKYDLLQFTKETAPYHGSLDDILPPVSMDDVAQSIKIAAANLYHAACHTFVHAPKESLPEHAKSFYKAARFVVQMRHYLRTGEYIVSKQQLAQIVAGDDRKILSDVPDENADVNAAYGTLISWCSELLQS